MAMLRNSTLNQLKRINSEIKKQGGTTDRRSDSEKNLPNAMWCHDPVDSDKSGKRKIATYDQMFSIDIPDASTKVTMKNEHAMNESKINPSKITKEQVIKLLDLPKDVKIDISSGDIDDGVLFTNYTKITILPVKDELKGKLNDLCRKANKLKNDIAPYSHAQPNFGGGIGWMLKYKDKVNETQEKNTNNMKNILSFEKMFENGPNDTPVEIMKNMKTIKNWFSEPEYSAKKEMSVGLIGKFIDTGKVKGYVNRIEGNDVFIDSIVEPLGLVKIPIKTAIKGYKPEKSKNTTVDISIEGPNDKSLAGAPKSGGGFSPKLDGESTNAKDQKISNKNNKEHSIKKLSDMSDEFDSTIIKKKSSSVAPEISSKSINAADQSISDKNIKIKKIAELDDLSQEPKGGKTGKGENTPGKTVDGKATKSIDTKITNKNTSVKTFTDMQSDFEGPKNKK